MQLIYNLILKAKLGDVAFRLGCFYYFHLNDKKKKKKSSCYNQNKASKATRYWPAFESSDII